MDLREQFLRPPDEYRPVPFWWWVGEPLTKERLAWQLDQIRSKGVLGAIISYNHDQTGQTERGEPLLFSKEWWELFRWAVGYCKEHGMKLGFKDYTIINPTMQEIGRQSPEMRGMGSLRQSSTIVRGGTSVKLTIAPQTEFLAAWAYKVDTHSAFDLTHFVKNGELLWKAQDGDWQVILISLEPHPFDPTHPTAGAKTIDALYGRFEKECPGEVGQTIKIIFQDELNFFQHTASHLPIYSPRIAEEFKKRKGYEVGPWLPALWLDLGPRTAKVRIDYNDVTTALMEEHFFKPIFQWCDERGVLLAQDNHGRGRMVIGYKLYGDYFRTMRWYHAPGTEDPGQHRGDAFKGFKINSSIAHLYRRPRVWNEAFHSSGWGFTPAQIVSGFDEDCAYGATFLNLHGLYYSTYGGWWEWAPPDFHFRQPYWQQLDGLSDYTARLNYLLSQGVHQCDVAIVYPITTIEAGLHGAETEAETQAFKLGRHLFDAGIDFDFIDDESIDRAVVSNAQLQVSGEKYRVLIFPMMGAARYASLEKARAFSRAGGVVIFYGCRPEASERAGSNDPELGKLLDELGGDLVATDYEAVRQLIDERIKRDFIPAQKNVYGLHRQIDGRDVYFVFNREEQSREVEVVFRAKGAMEVWDAWSGKAFGIGGTQMTEGTKAKLHLEGRQGQLVVFGTRQSPVVTKAAHRTVIPLDGSWEFELQPTLDNRFGDFRQPANADLIGAEAREFRYCAEAPAPVNWQAADFDDSAWEKVAYSFGPRLWTLGPIPPGTNIETLEQELRKLKAVDSEIPVDVGERSFHWMPYSFSLRWGIENDHLLKFVGSGPHGLRGAVTDEFISLAADQPGAVYFIWSAVNSSQAESLPFVLGSRAEYAAWFNGELVLAQNKVLPPRRKGLWGLPHHESTARTTTVNLASGSNALLLRFNLPENRELRAYAAFDPPPDSKHPLGLRWFNKPNTPVFQLYANPVPHAGLYRFQSPPGLRVLTIHARGPVEVWVDQQRLSVEARDAQTYQAIVPHPSLDRSTVAIRVEQPPDSYAGDSLPEPIELNCIKARAPLGDWSELGLDCYSGGAWYRRTILLTSQQAKASSILLQLGRVACAAEVHLNGKLIAKKITAPWSVELAGAACDGANQLEILITNTLANHYRVGVPSGYVLPGQTAAGWFGPAWLEIAEEHLTPHEPQL